MITILHALADCAMMVMRAKRSDGDGDEYFDDGRHLFG